MYAMRIAILTTGTRGDVQPFVALGAALRGRGHDVTMTAPKDLVSFVAAGDMAAVPLPFSAKEVLASELGQRFVTNGSIIAFLRAIMQLDALHRPALVDAFACAGEGAELVVAHPLTVGPALAVARARGAPLVRCYLGPTATTRALPSPVVDVGDLGPLNRLTHAVMLAAAGRGGAATTRALSRRLGVDPPRGNVFARAEEARSLALHLYSPVLQPRPDDWPVHHVLTGMLTLDAATRGRLG
ncbi:MAG: hypothetical protein A2138_09620 [Deltaproteobacteria bacterium RBG_16_71_12]|nr:MAG: hypothetical protein A2138_09620 [Deltaproteobacteria bacterium RBG_16_71_12]